MSTLSGTHDFSLPGVEWVSEDVQTAHHHCWVTACKRDAYCRYEVIRRGTQAHGQEATSALPKREILCLTRAASLQNRLEKEGRKVGKELSKTFRENKEKHEEGKLWWNYEVGMYSSLRLKEGLLHTARKPWEWGKKNWLHRWSISFAQYLVTISFSLLEAQPQLLRFWLGVDRK